MTDYSTGRLPAQPDALRLEFSLQAVWAAFLKLKLEVQLIRVRRQVQNLAADSQTKAQNARWEGDVIESYVGTAADSGTSPFR